jgi:hypothetical protein
VHLIYRDCLRAEKGCFGDGTVVVGPYPKAELTDDELVNDSKMAAAKNARTAASMNKTVSDAMAHNEKVIERLAGGPPMEFMNINRWKMLHVKSTDKLRQNILTFAERWARLMQLELAEGKTLKDCWYPMSIAADFEGISGSLLGAAVWALRETWTYGLELEYIYQTR